MTPIIRRFVMKMFSKDRGSGITQLPNQMQTGFQESIITEKLVRNGYDPKVIKDESELKIILNRIDATVKQSKEQKEKAMKQLATIMDMKGRKIKPGAKIMGGEEVIETEAEILERLKRGNKETVERIKEKKLTESFDPDMDDAIDNVSPGFSGDMKVDAELVAEELAGRAGKVYDDLDIRERMTFYDKAYKGLSEKRFDPGSGITKATRAKPIEARVNISEYIKDGKPDDDKLNALVDRDMILKEEADSLATKGENYERFQQISAERKNIMEIIEDVRKMFPEDMAQGGRAGFMAGGMGRRAFLKLMGMGGAGIAALKTGLINVFRPRSQAAQEVVEIVAKSDATGMPEHFMPLVNKIMNEGKLVKESDRIQTYKHPTRKDIDLEYELDSGSIGVRFDTDQGMKADYYLRKAVPDEGNPRGFGDEFIEGEIKYTMGDGDTYYKGFEEGIDTGTSNLDEFVGIPKKSASGAKVTLRESGDDFASGGIARMLGE